MNTGTEVAAGSRTSVDRAVLEGYGLRWAVLAAWADQLRGRGLGLAPEVRQRQEEARIKISSGCFPNCEVGCILGQIEADLMTAEGSNADTKADFWTELLAMAMSKRSEAERLLRIPAVKVHFSDCGVASCSC
jgi:hypothetical protein